MIITRSFDFEIWSLKMISTETEVSSTDKFLATLRQFRLNMFDGSRHETPCFTEDGENLALQETRRGKWLNSNLVGNQIFLTGHRLTLAGQCFSILSVDLHGIEIPKPKKHLREQWRGSFITPSPPLEFLSRVKRMLKTCKSSRFRLEDRRWEFYAMARRIIPCCQMKKTCRQVSFHVWGSACWHM